jgi:7-carboxy-7-deazaguanine synthase
MPEKFLVSEIFGPTIQGEGALIGQTSHFIRFAGCSYRCSWCDSMHAVDPDLIHNNSQRLDEDEILNTLSNLPNSAYAKWVTLSGGDPLHWELYELVKRLQADDFMVTVETQGAFWKGWLHSCDRVTCSPKPPSSGMSSQISYPTLDWYLTLRDKLNFKVVIFTEDDLDFAEHIHRKYPMVRLFLSAGTPVMPSGTSPFLMTHEVMKSYTWLVDETLKRPELVNATTLPQLHAMLWGNQKGK